ncbi:MAG: phage gp6-like head-tail connector protein [Rhodococcus sp.]|nr:phage gp6-like head-tail connector protein [Rhodococcus sp. (in: high G+C Gram-positive bacteria)]
MNNLVTLDEARDHLRLDEGPDDTWLATWIPVVSEAVALWLKDEWRLYQPEVDSDGEPVLDSDGRPVVVLDSDGEPVVRWAVKAACLVELASQYRFREGEGKDNVMPADAGHGYVLNKASTALLAPLRRPTVA